MCSQPPPLEDKVSEGQRALIAHRPSRREAAPRPPPDGGRDRHQPSTGEGLAGKPELTSKGISRTQVKTSTEQGQTWPREWTRGEVWPQGEGPEDCGWAVFRDLRDYSRSERATALGCWQVLDETPQHLRESPHQPLETTESLGKVWTPGLKVESTHTPQKRKAAVVVYF